MGLIYTTNMLVKGEKHYDRPRPWPTNADYDVTEAGGLFPDRKSARMAARRRKLIEPPAVPEGSWLLWMDRSMVPKGPLDDEIEQWFRRDVYLALMKHPERDCAYDEVDACVKYGKLEKRQGDRVKAMLSMRGLPRHYGLWACGVVAFRTGCHELRWRWWDIMLQTGLRDQVALPMALWETGVRKHVLTLEANIWKNDWFEWVPHGH